MTTDVGPVRNYVATSVAIQLEKAQMIEGERFNKDPPYSLVLVQDGG